MKIALTVSNNNAESVLDPRFGRAAKFMIYNTDNDESEMVDNTQNLNAAQGAGIQAAQNVIDAGAQAVITGNCGPKAFRVLSSAGVKIYTVMDVTVKEAVEAFKNGTLQETSAANVEGHWV